MFSRWGQRPAAAGRAGESVAPGGSGQAADGGRQPADDGRLRRGPPFYTSRSTGDRPHFTGRKRVTAGKMERLSERKNIPLRFFAEATLGRLAKWLRLFGFDTRYHSGKKFRQAAEGCAADRIVLTRTRAVARRLAGRQVVFIGENAPEEQLRRLVARLGLTAQDLAPFSRCLRCNRKTVPVPKEAVLGKVPDYVWQTASRFTFCEKCRNVYWPGTHTERALDRIRELFGETASEQKQEK